MLSIQQLKAISGCAKITPGAARASSSPGVPSPASQERTLPTELWVHALDYTWDIYVRDAKAVSRTLCRAGRLVLTRGQWAPVGKCVRAINALPWTHFGFDKEAHITDEVKALFCEAWKVAETWLLAEVAGPSWRWNKDMWITLGMLLKAAEPVISDDALFRVVVGTELFRMRNADFNWCVVESWHAQVRGDESD